MNEYSLKMESKQQKPTPSVGSRSSRASSKSRGSHKRISFAGKNRKSRTRISKASGNKLRIAMNKTVAPVLKMKRDSDKKLALTKSGYFGDKDSKTDMKSLEIENDQLVRELQLAVTALRAGLKDKPIRMRLSNTFVITTTVTTGVTNTITLTGGNNKLDPSLCSEWSTMAALFEEYKCLGGEVHFNYRNGVTPATGANLSPNSIPIMAYDADDNTSAASALALTQTSQHRSYDALLQTNADGNALPAVPAACIKHNFKWHVPRGTEYGSGTGAIAGTEWIGIASPQGAGYLKFYHLGMCITANDTGAGWIYFDLEFRCRS